jgi:lipopolysaccharide/colanic/teichoic acid biosynthesis glycosyltransferase
MTSIQKEDNLKEIRISDTHSIMRFNRFLINFIKRSFDIFASALGLLFLSPFFGLIALGIKRDSEGPIFYRATRIGRHGKPFTMLKFRTMYETPAAHNGSPITANGDDRITAFGAWLRDTKLNELPQLWNVLVGEMSLVGPRPEYTDFVDEWPDEVRLKVLSVRPGITSPASIIYRNEEKQLNGENFMDDYLKKFMPDKLRLDLLYVDNHSFATDLDVIFMTILAVLPRIRNVKIKERTLFSGPLYSFYSKHLSWFLVDFIAAFISVGVAGIVWRLDSPINLGPLRYLLLAFGMAISLSVINAFLGLHHIVWRYASPVHVMDIALSVFLTSIFIILVNRFWLSEVILTFDFMLNFMLLTFFLLVLARYRERLITGVANRWMSLRKDKKSLGERVLVVGAGAGGELAVWLLQKSEHASAFSIIGYVDDDYRKQNAQMAGYPVLGTTADIPTLVKKQGVGLILYSISKISDAERSRILDLCQQSTARVIAIPDLMEVLRKPLQKSII